MVSSRSLRSQTQHADTQEEQSTAEDVQAAPTELKPEAVATESAAGDRRARFAALKARNSDSRKANLAETKSEHQRQTTDTTALTSLNRKRDVAAQKLLRADTAAAGEDFERKRAWDWTVEESERWDRRVEKKSKHKDDAPFQDFSGEARKGYKRQLRNIPPDREAYDREKTALIERAAKGGGLEIVETAEGELIAVDREGKFYSTAESTEFVGNKPSRAAIDRLVGDIKKAEEVRMKNRRKRQGDEEGDVTYINDKNKLFNQKLARFYDKYTADIRESFERGTAI